MKAEQIHFSILCWVVLSLVLPLLTPSLSQARNCRVTSIAAGADHTAALKNDGSVMAVGENSTGATNVSSWRSIKAIAAGYERTVGLREDGTVAVAGAGLPGDEAIIASWTNIKALALEYDHMIGLKEDGTVVVTGLNPSLFSTWRDIKSVAVGGYQGSTFGIKEDGTVLAVGLKNAWGQLNVSSWTNIVAISASTTHTVGLKADGTVVAVGGNWYGQLEVSSWTNIVAVAAGYHNTVGLKEDGTVVVVGDNRWGQLQAASWTGITAIDAGAAHILGLKEDGTVVGVGNNHFSQSDLNPWTGVAQASAGDAFTVAVKQDGTVAVTGINAMAVGVDTRTWTDIVAVEGGNRQILGLRADGTVMFFGETTIPNLDEVSSWTNIVGVSAGYSHAVGLRADGTVVAVGLNMTGEVSGVSSWTDIKAVDAHHYHTIGLKKDGTVVAAGRFIVPSSWTGIAAIAAGFNHAAALRPDGTVLAGGDNTFGQLEVSSWRNIVAIAAGYFTTVGLRADGSVVAVGRNTYGELNVSSWTDIKGISAGYSHIVGVRQDGTVVASGANTNSESAGFYAWNDVVQPACWDTTPPVTTAVVTGTVGNNGWYLSNVTISLSATGSASGIKEIHYSLDGGVESVTAGGTAAVTVTADGSHSFTFYALDNAGKQEAPQVIAIPIDRGNPSVIAVADPAFNGNGWNNTDVTVSFACNDALSGVLSCTQPVLVSAEGRGQVVSGTAIDSAGNTASASVTLNMDRTAPTIQIGGVTDGASYVLGAAPAPVYSASDALSGIVSQAAQLSGGSANGAGSYTYSVNAADLAGNSATVTAVYSVIYDFGGFLPPVSLGHPFKLGRTVPVKFQLIDADRNYIATAKAAFTLQKYSSDVPVGDPIDAASTSGADTGNMFRYDTTCNQYIYNLDTSPLSAGTWQIRATLDDGTVRTAFISLKAN